MASKYDALENLYKAVSAYCEASVEAGKQRRPIPEHYWRDVELTRNAAMRWMEPGKGGELI